MLRLFRELMSRKEDRDAVLQTVRDFGNEGLKLSERRLKAQQEVSGVVSTCACAGRHPELTRVVVKQGGAGAREGCATNSVGCPFHV